MKTENKMQVAEDLADSKTIKELDSVKPTKLITSTKLNPLSGARKLIIADVIDYLSNSKVYGASEINILMLTVYILAEKDILTIKKLSRDGRKLFEKAVKFADDPKVDWMGLCEEAQEMVTQLDTSEALLNNGIESEELSEAEKK